MARDAAGLRLFLDEYGDAVCGGLLHGGEEMFAMGERVLAVPWWRVI